MQRASRPSADEARDHFRRIPLGRAVFLRCVRCSTLDDAVHRFRAKRLLSGENRSRRGRRDFFSSLLAIAAEQRSRDISPHRAALLMRIPPNRPGQILAGKRGISADTAPCLARLLGPGARCWMTLQAQHDLAPAKKVRGQAVRANLPVLQTG